MKAAQQVKPIPPSQRRRRVGHPQNLGLNSQATCSREIIRKLRYGRCKERRVGHPPTIFTALHLLCSILERD